jgi:hypothetical protein
MRFDFALVSGIGSKFFIGAVSDKAIINAQWSSTQPLLSKIKSSYTVMACIIVSFIWHALQHNHQANLSDHSHGIIVNVIWHALQHNHLANLSDHA